MSTSPAEVCEDINTVIDGLTVPKSFLQTVAAHGDLVALRNKNVDDSWSELTYNEMAAQVARAATGLAERGLGRGDRLMLMMRNRPEFHILDMAGLMVGATVISIYNSSSADQISYLANDAEAKMVIAGDAGFLSLIRQAAPSIASIDSVGVVSTDGAEGADFTLDDLLSSDPGDLEELAEIAQPADLATLIYTSGTTGPSKGVMLDHTNIAWTTECINRILRIDDQAGKRLVSYLPMAHIAERMISYYAAVARGYEITCCPEPALFAAYASEVHPNLMFGVPRVWEKIYGGVAAALSADPEKEKAVREAVEAAGPIQEKITWGTATPEEIETYEFLDAVAFSTIRALVGLDQLDSAITGAAPIPAEMLAWFRTIGVPLSEIYGLSETSGPLSWSAYEVKPGSVGQAIPGLEVKLGEDGEVLCRGGNVFRGYLNQPEQTASVLSEDGWFATGDIGEIDDDGYLKIVDRKKELIITAGGKNISPSNLEASIKMIPLVGQAIAIGDQRPFVSALVVLDPDVAPSWAERNGLDHSDMNALANHPDVIAEIEAALPGVMKNFSNAEKIKKVRVLGEEWMPDTDLLTPTSKLKRRGIHARFADEIEALYS